MSSTGTRLPRHPLGTDHVLQLQRTAGNAATTRLLRSGRGQGAPIPVQRAITRGSGWGWPNWVANGYETWTGTKKKAGLDPLFNTQLGSVIDLLRAKQELFPAVKDELQGTLDELVVFREEYDTTAINFTEDPKGQAKSAETILKALTGLIARGESVAKGAKTRNREVQKARKKQEKKSEKSLASWIDSLEGLQTTATDTGFDRSALGPLLRDLLKRQKTAEMLDEGFISRTTETIEDLGESFAQSNAAKLERERRAGRISRWRKSARDYEQAIGDYPLVDSTAVAGQARDLISTYAAAPEPTTVEKGVSSLLDTLKAGVKAREDAVLRGWDTGLWGALALSAPKDVVAFAVGSRPATEYAAIIGNASAVTGRTVAEMTASATAWTAAITRYDYIMKGEDCRAMTPKLITDTPALTFEHRGTYRASIDKKETSDYSFGYSRKYRMRLGTTWTDWELHVHYKRDKSGSEGASYIHFTTSVNAVTKKDRTNPVSAHKYNAVMTALPKLTSVWNESSVLSEAESHLDKVRH